ncbi:general transcriptional corepressor trfA isoform X2 [Chelonus insularis]|uniref:general transcriptional corepressor trfA isoform X2 n=1 Tax=Chelonus insularis TaxID=460826 RepID=UPI001589EC69|nr:general transcriptional corepressor trfA isoform X2 [Chelonus insularis]
MRGCWLRGFESINYDGHRADAVCARLHHGSSWKANVMRIKDALMPSVNHSALNNNQLNQESLGVASGSEAIENLNESASEKTVNYNRDQSQKYESQGFRVAEDTTTWSSVAIARTNVNNHPKRVNNIINNNLSLSKLSLNSSTESLSDYDGHELSAGSECSDNSDDGSLPRVCRGIINPNYPGFQHLAPAFLSVFSEEEQSDSRDSSVRINDQESENKINDCCNNNNNNNNNLNNNNNINNNHNNKDEEKEEAELEKQIEPEPVSVNRLDIRKEENKFFYDKSKLNIQTVTSFYEDVVSSSEKCLNYVKSIEDSNEDLLDISKENLPHWHHHLPVEIEVAELQSTSTERPQFAEIEEIPSESSKTYEQDSESEEITIGHIDLISEVTRLPNDVLKPEVKEENTSSKLSDDSETTTDSEGLSEEQPYTKLEEIDLLSSIGRDIGVNLEKYVQPVPDVVAMESVDVHSRPFSGLVKDVTREDTNKLVEADLESCSADMRKKEKMARNQARRRQQSFAGRRPDKRREHGDKTGSFDVYNIETAMPKIDLDAIESHLRAAREEERRRRNDREEIRRRLAMGPDADDIRSERGRKPSLQSRLQSGMNLQICFMNESPSDTESPGSEDTPSGPKPPSQSYQQHSIAARPQVLSLPPLRLETDISSAPLDEADFFARQARLQTEARMALAQAKEMAHMQMEVERQRLKQSPITEMVRSSLEKVGVQLGEDRRRLSRVLLTELNVAQLQVVANDLHARIAVLNEALVEGLLRRDDLHMEQDSMLVDVEDLTRYLGAKQESFKKRQASIKEQATIQENNRSNQQHRQQFHSLVMPIIRTKFSSRSLVGLVKK